MTGPAVRKCYFLKTPAYEDEERPVFVEKSIAGRF
jgi:hypothetical protein